MAAIKAKTMVVIAKKSAVSPNINLACNDVTNSLSV
jgi:hypothetical protein